MNREELKKIGIFITILLSIFMIFFNFGYCNEIIQIQTEPLKTAQAVNITSQIEKKCFKTNGATNIELNVEENEIDTQKDLIFYIRTNKSIKGRTVKLMDNGISRENEKEVAFINEDNQYCYQYTFLTFKGSKIENITISNLPEDDIILYAWIKYNGKEYQITSAKNLDTEEDLLESTDKTLIPTNKLTEEQIANLKAEDVATMKQKWADALKIDISEVDKYIDLYNAKGQGKLHKDGKIMKNSKGEPVMLNGVGLFHLLDYGYMYNEETLKALKYWGINCIRIPAYLQYRVSNSFDTVTRAERGLDTAYDEHIAEMDRIIDIATKEGLYCMVDFHILGTDGDILQWKDTAENFFEHFASKYGEQDNILYELANEPFGTSKENLATYVQEVSPIIKKYDNNPIIIVGAIANEYLSNFYKYFKTQVNDVFISYHYYDGTDYEPYKNLYESTDIPLIYSEWGNSDGNTDSMTASYTEMTKKYLKWWNENNVANCAWMLCHGEYTYSLWNTNLGAQEEALEYGCISDDYLSDYGKLVFNTYLENTIERVKNNEVYINRKDEATKDEIPEQNNTNDPTIAKQILPKAGSTNILVLLIVLISIVLLFAYFELKSKRT